MSKQWRAWKHQLWGVVLKSPYGDSGLLGASWNGVVPLRYAGEPQRPLLFTSRKACREWCKAKHSSYDGAFGVCAKWRFVTVRVTQTISPQ